MLSALSVLLIFVFAFAVFWKLARGVHGWFAERPEPVEGEHGGVEAAEDGPNYGLWILGALSALTGLLHVLGVIHD